MKRLSIATLCLGFVLVPAAVNGPAPARVQAQEATERPVGAAARKSAPDVDAGLAWLVRHQGADGSWGQNNKLALTGMAGLALLASGSTPQRGPFAGELRRAVQFVLRSQREDRRAYQDPSSGYSAIHNHGYALLFLTQAYGEGGPLDEQLRTSIQLGVYASIRSQFTEGDSDGGFGYFLYRRVVPRHSNMWQVDEASTTIAVIQALRGARNAGFTVDRRALERAGDYIARSQHASGGFVYSIGDYRVSFVEDSDRPTFAITAACTAVLHALGSYEGPKVEAGIDYLEAFIPPTRRKIHFFYYAHYYAAQVMHLVGGTRGRRWMEAISAELASRQRADGRWAADPEDTLAAGDSQVLNTAWALQIALIDRGMLPMHER